VTFGVVLGLQSIDIDVGRHELSASAPGAIDFALNVSQPGTSAAHSGELVIPGVFTVLGGLQAIVGRNLAIATRLGAVGGGVSSRLGSPGAVGCRVLAVARRS
jgi:hypothetical protein